MSPNKPKTPIMSFRVDPELQEAAREALKVRRAAGYDESLTDVVRKALESYVRSAKKEKQ